MGPVLLRNRWRAMSRGPGWRQRVILDAVAAAPVNDDGLPVWVSVDDVSHCAQRQRLPVSERESIRRAMRTLAAVGAVDIGCICRPHGPMTLAVRRVLTDEECLLDATCLSYNWRDIWRRAGRMPEEANVVAHEKLTGAAASVTSTRPPRKGD